MNQRPRFSKLNQSGFDHILIVVVFVVLFALIGTFLIIETHAASWTGALKLSSVGNLCLNDNNSSKAKGTTIGIYTCGNYTSEKWSITKFSNGQFELENGMGVCADDWGYGVSTATTKAYLKTYSCSSSDHAQIWEWNGHLLEDPYTKGCINDPAYSKTSGTGLIIYPCNSSYANEQVYEVGLTSSSSSGSSSSSSGSTTANTCPSPKPVAPVSGYTIAACEDFNTSGLGDFGAYSGGGSGTVVGTGRTPSQCSVTGGILELKQASSGATCGGWMNNFGQQYGLWEVRMRAYSTGTSGSAPHPVLILWPSSGAWTSELDFFETNIGSSATGYLHCTGSNVSSNCYTLPSNSVNYSQWHTYSILWTSNSMAGYIDGAKWWSTTNTSSFQPEGASNLTIQLDNLSGSTPVKAGEMDIDWAHMFKS